ncbi:AbgT family transporter [Clostridium fallax]|uniref:Aminobenzoyl-glutamate transport protein n=1 Tax=Clostridium fallax TaxID=1533 RepID=A0A1M4Z0K8_9CLOT|nr:AbgT family transporter [Clostridium fallax]SHF11574.1 aminobenzoyl-glutamate transport protein [Clostridium fallax]SQB22214.1 aminobenzoyl-glutamate transport protein [Clostridium fallax]
MENNKKRKGIQRFLDGIEKVGNKLPHPATIFVILCVIVTICSHLFSKMGVGVIYEGIDRATNELKEMSVSVKSLLEPEGIRYMFTSAVKNFTNFAPLGTVLVALLGVGVAEGTGLIAAVLRKVVMSTPKRFITIIVVLAGVVSNIASDAGYVVLIPLGAVIFMSFGRHPIAGIAAAFAGVSGGFSANIVPGPTDALLAGLTQEGVKMVDASYNVSITGNWFFLIVSTVLITIIGTLVTEKIIEPRLGKYKGKYKEEMQTITPEEKRGLKFAGIAMILFLIFIGAFIVPKTGILRNPETGEILNSPFMKSIVVVIALFFLVPGVAYGIGSRKVKNDKDVISLMGKSMSSMGSYIVLVFFAAQFVEYFSYTNLGTVIAVKGADFLETTGLTGIPLIIAFILVAAFINLFMGSASAKWAIMAPIFVPMFLRVGAYTPEFTQMAYRIGDSVTNIISPLMSYFALIVCFTQKYDEDSGMGTLISTMLPYTIAFLIGWAVLLIIWYVLGLPLGPGVGITV